MPFVTWNPADKHSEIDLSNGNLTATNPTQNTRKVRATLSRSSGKYYFEGTITGKNCALGLLSGTASLTGGIVGNTVDGWGVYATTSFATRFHSGGSSSMFAASYVAGDTLRVAVDFNAGKIWFGYNGTWQGDPAAGTGASYSDITGTLFPAWNSGVGPAILTVKFGGIFKYAMPSGFSAWDDSVFPIGAGLAEGTSTAEARSPAVPGTADGTSTATAYSSAVAGAAAGVGAASGAGLALRQAAGTAAGTSAAIGYTNLGVGNAAGTSSATASGAGLARMTGAAAGSSAALAYAAGVHQADGVAAGTSAANAYTPAYYAETLASTINISSQLELSNGVVLASTINLDSLVSGSETQSESSTFDLTSDSPSLRIHTGQFASAFAITENTDLRRTLKLLSTFNLASSVIPTTRFLELVSQIDLAASATVNGRRSVSLESVIDLRSSVDEILVSTLVSTMAVSSGIIGTRHNISTEASTINLASSATVGLRATTKFTSSIVLSSVVSGRVNVTQAFASVINLQSFVLLPNGTIAALWCNPVSTAAATWDGTPFESMIESDGVVYAAGGAGIYRLDDAVDDNGLPIAAYVMWDLLDFGDPKKHRPGSVVIGGFAAAPLKIRVVNEQGRFEYLTHLPSNTKATNLRAKLGKGLNSRYNRFTVLNTAGKDFGFNDGSVEIVKLSRHIGGTHA